MGCEWDGRRKAVRKLGSALSQTLGLRPFLRSPATVACQEGTLKEEAGDPKENPGRGGEREGGLGGELG
jgi:hypothetical protein